MRNQAHSFPTKEGIMVFGSSLLLMTLLLSGGQPTVPEDQPIVSSVKKTATAESEAGSPAPCPDTSGKKTCKDCNNTCPETLTKSDGLYKFDHCGYESYALFKGIVCYFKHVKTGKSDY